MMMQRWRNSPIAFIEDMWGLYPQGRGVSPNVEEKGNNYMPHNNSSNNEKNLDKQQKSYMPHPNSHNIQKPLEHYSQQNL